MAGPGQIAGPDSSPDVTAWPDMLFADIRQPVPDTFAVRLPQPAEQSHLADWLPPHLLAAPDAVRLVAATHPSGQLLGAAVVAPLPDGVGAFDLFVRPEVRRRKVGTALLAELKLAATAAGCAGLRTAQMIHEALPAAAFCPAVGLTPIRRYVTHCTTVGAVQAVADRLLARFAAHPHLQGVAAVPLPDLSRADVVRFLIAEHGGLADRYHAQLAADEYCPVTSVGAVADGRLTGVLLMKVAEVGYFCDLVVSDRQLRPGPTPLFLLAAACRRARGPGVPVVFEADPEHDWNFAERCGATRHHTRFVFGTAGDGLTARRPAARLVGFVTDSTL